MKRKEMLSVLFVCMGNICRSPTAEGYFRHHVQRLGLSGKVRADSAGTHGYHIGAAPDARSQATARQRGVDISQLRARQVRPSDFHDFDLLVAMDRANLEILQGLAPADGSGAALHLMLEFSEQWPGSHDVPDPYYGGPADFDHVCDLLDEATAALAKRLMGEQSERNHRGQGRVA